jgi:hypothetical protein
MMACRRGQPRIGQSRTPIWFCGIVSDCIICRVRKIIQCSLALRAASHLRRQAFLIKIRLLTCRPSRTRRAVALIRLRAYEAHKTGFRCLEKSSKAFSFAILQLRQDDKEAGALGQSAYLRNVSLPMMRSPSQCPGTSAPRSHQRCPDFLLCGTHHDHACGFLPKKAADVAQRDLLDGKSGIRGPKKTGEAQRPLLFIRT